MELFRKQPSLCSLFLRLLEEWGAQTLDWSLLRDEVFVDRFLRRLLTSQEIEEEALFKACCSLVQPSVGGLLVAPILARGGHFDADEFDGFVQFAVMGKAAAWDPMSWPELLTVLEEVAFSRESDPSTFLAALTSNGWVPEGLRARYRQRIWQTCRLSRAEKQRFEAWLRGELVISNLQSVVTHSSPGRVCVRQPGHLGQYRRGFSPRDREALG